MSEDKEFTPRVTKFCEIESSLDAAVVRYGYKVQAYEHQDPIVQNHQLSFEKLADALKLINGFLSSTPKTIDKTKIGRYTGGDQIDLFNF